MTLLAFNITSFLTSGAVVSLARDQLLVAYGPSDRKTHEDELDPSKPAFFISDFFLQSATPWVQYSHFQQIAVSELLSFFDTSSHPLPEASEWKIGHKATFLSAIQSVQPAFADESLKKVVPYVFSYSNSLMSTQQLIHSLHSALLNIQTYPGYLYGCWDANEGFLGVTPEILFKYNHSSPQSLETMALAGTLSKTHTLEDISDKLMNEHQIVVDSIIQTLQPFGGVKTQLLRLLSLSSFSHLMTPILLQLNQPFSFTALVKALHPTPALGAYPSEKGGRWLRTYNSLVERQAFGVPFGIVLKKNALCYVAIRQVQWNAHGMRIGAGCGVVKESQSKEEWNEIELKISAIKGVLGL